MKTYTKVTILILALFTSFLASAQRFGVKIGGNMSKIHMNDDLDFFDNGPQFKPGIHLGITAEKSITDMFAIEATPILNMKGYSISENYKDNGFDYKLKGGSTLFYADLPINIKAYFNVSEYKVFGAVGPYVGMGLSGKTNYKYTYGDESESNSDTIKWGNDSDADMKRLDYGMQIGGGVEINKMQVGLFFTQGLANLTTDSDGSNKINNQVISISLSYFLK